MPEWPLAATRIVAQPAAYAAYAMSTTRQWLDSCYHEMFPRG
jgi:hypothetical protein